MLGPAPAVNTTGELASEVLRYAGAPDERKAEFEHIMSTVTVCDLKRFICTLEYIAKYHLKLPLVEARYVDYPPPGTFDEMKTLNKTPPAAFDVFSVNSYEFQEYVMCVIQYGQINVLEQALSSMGQRFSSTYTQLLPVIEMHYRFVLSLATALKPQSWAS